MSVIHDPPEPGTAAPDDGSEVPLYGQETPPDGQDGTQGAETPGGTPADGTGDQADIAERQVVTVNCDCGHDFKAVAGDYVTCPKCNWRHSVGALERLTEDAVPVVCECEYHFFAYPTKNRLVPCPECDKTLTIPMTDEPGEAEAERIADLAKVEGWQIEVMEANRVCTKFEEKMHAAEASLVSAKGILKAAEADYGTAVAELRETVKGKREPRLPLTPGGPDGQDEDVGPDSQQTLKLDPQQSDEAWLATELAALDLTDKLVERLNIHKMITIGDVAAWGGQDHHLSDLAGIGQVAQKKIEDAIDKYWETRITPLGAEGGEDKG